MIANEDYTLTLVETIRLHPGNCTITYQLVSMIAVLAGVIILGVHLFDPATHASRFRECFLPQADRLAIPGPPLCEATTNAIALLTAVCEHFASAICAKQGFPYVLEQRQQTSTASGEYDYDYTWKLATLRNLSMTYRSTLELDSGAQLVPAVEEILERLRTSRHEQCAKLLRALFGRVGRKQNPELVIEILLTRHPRGLRICKRDVKSWTASRKF